MQSLETGPTHVSDLRERLGSANLLKDDLAKLESQKLIQGRHEGRKKIYMLTRNGHLLLPEIHLLLGNTQRYGPFLTRLHPDGTIAEIHVLRDGHWKRLQ